MSIIEPVCSVLQMPSRYDRRNFVRHLGLCMHRLTGLRVITCSIRGRWLVNSYVNEWHHRFTWIIKEKTWLRIKTKWWTHAIADCWRVDVLEKSASIIDILYSKRKKSEYFAWLSLNGRHPEPFFRVFASFLVNNENFLK